ncbi:hypothetical protein J4E93_009118 [Alternaria ventricosa]|uniref:uncharacterized protein n=1 Tax=Alternaria ventricosa TaxID=1187951 RepID=UPI0020C369BB|nr:uncharacterized protein J4E93_009118 [Alternaria ventricosa]KAI4639764.1 hypothetical protein J4E93_009118 [Alternaria ventricosa]
MKPRGTLLHHEYNQFFRSFVKHTLPKDDLYDVARAFNTVNDLVFLQFLLSIANLDMNWRWFAKSLLIYAAGDGNECLVLMLLDVGVSINARRALGDSSHKTFNVLQFAILGGHKTVIDLLSRQGSTIFTGHPAVDSDFLFDAITQGTMDLARPLLVKAATPGAGTTRKGVAVLVHAVEQSYDKIVDILFDAGFNPYSKSYVDGRENFKSAFIAALHASKTSYLEKFLKFAYYGPAKEQPQQCLQQLTAGYVFAQSTENIHLKNAIIDTGWHPDDVRLVMGNDFIQSCLSDALEAAIERGDRNRVDRLVRIGADPNHRHNYPDGTHSRSPLSQAIATKDVSMVRQLLAVGADVNFLDSLDETPLQDAVITSDLEIVSLLVDAGANVNLRTRRWNRSAIEIAAGGGQLGMVRYLLALGADIQGRHNRVYRRTLFRAKRAGYDSIVDLLQDWKRSKYGEQDCDTIDNVMETMRLDEHGFPSKEDWTE